MADAANPRPDLPSEASSAGKRPKGGTRECKAYEKV